MVSRAEASQEIVRLLPAVVMGLRLATLLDLEAADSHGHQVLTLMLVSSAPNARMKAGEIARRLEISLPAATALVDRLVSAGVFERSQGQDRRVVWVSVTEASVLVEPTVGRARISHLRLDRWHGARVAGGARRGGTTCGEFRRQDRREGHVAIQRTQFPLPPIQMNSRREWPRRLAGARAAHAPQHTTRPLDGVACPRPAESALRHPAPLLRTAKGIT